MTSFPVETVSEDVLQDVQAVRSEILDSVITASAIFALIGISAPLLRYLELGSLGVLLFHGSAAIIVAIVAVFRRKLSYQVRASVYLGLMFLSGAYGLFTWGLVGMGLFFLVTCGILAALFVSLRSVILITLGVLAVIAVAWVGRRTGLITFNVDVDAYAAASSSWLVAFVGAWFFISISALTVRRLHGFMLDSIVQLNQQRWELQEINVRLQAEIATRVKAEETLRENEEKYRALFQGSMDAIVMTTPNGTIVDVNPAAISLFGSTREDLITRNAQWMYVNPDDRERFVSKLEQDGTVYDFEVPLRRKDGAERECLLISSLWKSDDGELRGFQTIIRDITARKQAERQLRQAYDQLEERVAERTAELTLTNSMLQQEIAEREYVQHALQDSKEQFTLFMDMLPHGVFIKDEDFRFVYVNQYVKDFLRGEHWIGRTLEEAVPEDWRLVERAAMDDRQALAEGQVRAEESILDKDGNERILETTKFRISRADKPPLLGTILLDVTHRVLAERKLATALDSARRLGEEAEAANRAKSEFVANISHEIRTPLNAIVGMVELVLDAPLSEDQRNRMKVVRASADALYALLNDVLDFSKIEAGKIDLDDAPFSIRECLASIVSLLRKRSKDKNLNLEYQVSDDIPDTLVGDPNRLRPNRHELDQ